MVNRSVALRPDGSRHLYVGANGTTLFVRPLDQLEATPLIRGASVRDPFVSPDGQWVGFFDGTTTLMKVALTGGPAMLVTQLDSVERGATWAPDGTIIFATASTGLRRTSVEGRAPTVLTRVDRDRGEAGHSWPELLPGGQAVLYTVMAAKGGLDAASIALVDTRTGQQTTVLRGGTHGQYASSGQLLYGAAGTLRAIKFDLTSRLTTGLSALVVPQALMYSTGAIEAALARDGTLAYVAGGAGGELRTLVWVDRQGRETPTGAPPRAYISPRLSPDGTRVATVVVSGKGDVWTWNLAQSTLTPLTLEPAIHGNPVWMPDGRLAFSSDRTGAINIYRKAADGSGVIERLSDSPNAQTPSALAPDGTLLFTERSSTTGSDVMALRMNAAHQVIPLVQTPSDERNGIVSPDGRWLAYDANDTGTFEIYVRPFPDVTRGHWLVSTNGGIQPLWSHSGQELFYLAPDGALMRVVVGSGPAWSAGPPTKLLEGRYVVNVGNQGRNYDITADGRRFLMMKANGTPEVAPQIIVVQHFDEELRRLVPMK